MSHPLLRLHPSVAEELAGGGRLVALESTIITHGMPYPANIETAASVEDVIRDEGATPATIAILDGELKVGLTEGELERLGRSSEDAVKVSRRDLPFVISQKKIGGTTVAATMIVARMAGIGVFATGGIGGVHRDAGNTFDISADLQELAATRVTVVSAGFKSILDLGSTLEYLETHGVPVVGYRTRRLPAFYCRDSSFEVDYRLDTPEQIAEIMDLRQALELKGGIVVANPIPEEHSLDRETMDAAIESALEEAKKAGVSGKETTPFLLDRVVGLTKRKSLSANVALVKNNARLAARLAKAVSRK